PGPWRWRKPPHALRARAGGPRARGGGRCRPCPARRRGGANPPPTLGRRDVELRGRPLSTRPTRRLSARRAAATHRHWRLRPAHGRYRRQAWRWLQHPGASSAACRAGTHRAQRARGSRARSFQIQPQRLCRVFARLAPCRLREPRRPRARGCRPTDPPDAAALRFGTDPRGRPRAGGLSASHSERTAMAYKALDLTGKVALVTGGNSGIGLGMAEAMAQAGAAVCIWGTNEAKNDAAVKKLKAQGGKAMAMRCDVSDEAAVDRCFAETLKALGRVDAFFAHARVSGRGRRRQG